MTKLFVKHAAEAILAVVMAIGAAHCTSGCYASVQKDLEDAYNREQKACVDQARTLEESQECRRLVRRRYNVCGGDAEWPQYSPCGP